MVFIIIEIFGLSILRQQKKHIIDPLMEKIHRLFYIYEDNLFLQRGDTLVFKMRFSEASRNKILFNLKDLNTILKDQNRYLNSYTIIAEFIDDDQPDTVHKHLFHLLFQADQNNRLYFGPGFQALVPEVGEGEKSLSLLKVHSDRFLQEFYTGSLANNPVYDVIETLMDFLYPEIETTDSDSVRSGDVLFLTGSSIKLLNQGICHLQDKIHHDSLPDPLEVYYDIQEPVYYPFLRAVDSQIAEKAGDLLTGNDQQIWEEFSLFYKQPYSDFSFESFLTGFSLYLKAYQMIFNSSGHWPLFIVYIPDKLDDLSSRLLKKILKQVSVCGGIIPVLCGSKDDCSAIQSSIDFKFRAKKYHLPDDEGAGSRDSSVSEMPFLQAQILYLAGLNSSIHSKADFVQICEQCGFTPGDTAAALEELRADQLLFFTGQTCNVDSQFFLNVKTYLGDEGRRLNVQFINALIHLIRKKKIPMIGIPRFIKEIQPDKFGVNLFYRYCDYLFNMNQQRELKGLLNHGYSLFSYLRTPRQRQLVEFCLSFLRFRLAISLGDQGKGALLLSQLERSTVPEEYHYDFQLAVSLFYFSAGDYVRSLEFAKKALTSGQLEGQDRWKGMNLIAYSMMSRKAFAEAEEYFQMIVEDMDPSGGNIITRCYAWTGTYLNQFLKGNHSYGLRLIDSARKTISTCGLRELDFYRQFLSGRIEFDLGRYEDVADRFWTLLNSCRLFPNPGRKKTIQAWIARSAIYSGQYKAGMEQLLDLPKDMEVHCFLAEGYLFQEEFTNAMFHIQKGLAMEEQARVSWQPIEQIDWKNGFCSIEDRAFSGREGQSLLYYYLKALEGYVNCLLGNPEGYVDLQKMNRDEHLSEFYPHFSLFGYLLALSVSPDRQIDQNTILGKSVKNLQERAARIDLPKAKIDFLNRNLWNKKLMDLCRKNHLI